MSESSDPTQPAQLLLRNLAVEDLNALMPQYEFDSMVAEGGMGKVFLATQKSLDRPVAIKLLKSEFGRDEAFRESFKAEAKSMAKLNHPNLVGVYDFGEIQGLLFIVMEFVEGQTLHDACHGSPLVVEEAAEIIAGTCRGLAHAHEAGIIHRDIKPANILVNSDLHPKLVDFGVAESSDTVHADSEQIFGTPDYAAPEMCASPPQISEKSDIYAMGVPFYELLTGMLPQTPYIPPSKITDTPPKYDHLVAKAMHESPEQRFTHIAEFAEDIEQLLANPDSAYFQTQALAAKTPALNLAPAAGATPYRPPIAPPKKSGAGAFIGTLLTLGLLGAAAYHFLYPKETADPSTPLVDSAVAGLPSPEPTEPLEPVIPPPAMAEEEPPPTQLTPDAEEEPSADEDALDPDQARLGDLAKLSPIATTREWTLPSGETCQGSLKGFDNQKAQLTLEDGRMTSLSTADMNAGDKAYSQAWLKKQRFNLSEELVEIELKNKETFTGKPIGLWRNFMLYLDPDGSPKSINLRAFDKKNRFIIMNQFRSRYKADLYNEAHPEKERTWTSKQGKEITATLASISGNVVTFNKGDKEYVLTTDKLSAKDVDYLRSWLNARDISDQSLVR